MGSGLVFVPLHPPPVARPRDCQGEGARVLSTVQHDLTRLPPLPHPLCSPPQSHSVPEPPRCFSKFVSTSWPLHLLFRHQDGSSPQSLLSPHPHFTADLDQTSLPQGFPSPPAQRSSSPLLISIGYSPPTFPVPCAPFSSLFELPCFFFGFGNLFFELQFTNHSVHPFKVFCMFTEL